MQNKAAAILAAILIIIPFYTSGQKSVNSPFARFNLGIIEPAGSFRSLGMGGTGSAIRDNLNIYYTNPASYSSLDTNSFVFDFGIDYGMNYISDGKDNNLSEDMNFDHLIIGFPVAKKWGVTAGLVSVSNGFYNIAEYVREGDPDYDPITGEYTSFHEGSGGLTTFFLGTGLNLTKNLSAGVNMSFLFGTIKRFNEFDFLDYYYTYQTNMTENFTMTGIGLDLGLQYSASLRNDYFLNTGISLSTGRNCKVSYENITYRFNAYSVADTLTYSMDDSTRSHLPGTVRGGLSFGKKNKFVAAIDYIYTPWTNSDLPGSDAYLANSQSVLIGAEYTPDKYSNYSFLKRVDYRLGGHFGNSYLSVNGNKISETGASIGIGVPMRKTFSKVNFFCDYTRRSISGEPFTHIENYVTFGLSLNMYDLWFRQRKYD